MPFLTNKYDISIAIGFEACDLANLMYCTGIFKQYMGAKKPSSNRVVVPARPELIPWNRFLGSLKV
jgi:hypothetical protein